ncbi:MAG TPA: phosphotransferase [Pirellulales bacterium]
MHDNRYDLTPVLAAYPADCQPAGGKPCLVAGGFSGSTIWRFSTLRGPVCMRRWPREHPSATQLQWIHSVLARTAATGFDRIPLPISTAQNATFVESQGHLWELAPWLPGESDNAASPEKISSLPRIAAAAAALALFHVAAAVDRAHRYPATKAPGLQSRLDRMRQLSTSGLEQLGSVIKDHRNRWPELASRADCLLDDYQRAALTIEPRLRSAASVVVSITPCIRDIHREHVLFEGEQVTGIIDFGAMQTDNVACDIARLMGSMARDDASVWKHGLTAYQQYHPLTDAELQLVRAYDESTVLLSGINWLRWVFDEGRTFSNPTAVLARFDQNAARLRQLASKSASTSV